MYQYRIIERCKRMVATSFDCGRPNYLHKTKLICKSKVVRRGDDMSGMRNLDWVRSKGVWRSIIFCNEREYEIGKESTNRRTYHFDMRILL